MRCSAGQLGLPRGSFRCSEVSGCESLRPLDQGEGFEGQDAEVTSHLVGSHSEGWA